MKVAIALTAALAAVTVLCCWATSFGEAWWLITVNATVCAVLWKLCMRDRREQAEFDREFRARWEDWVARESRLAPPKAHERNRQGLKNLMESPFIQQSVSRGRSPKGRA
jgi:fatty acid desaturase